MKVVQIIDGTEPLQLDQDHFQKFTQTVISLFLDFQFYRLDGKLQLFYKLFQHSAVCRIVLKKQEKSIVYVGSVYGYLQHSLLTVLLQLLKKYFKAANLQIKYIEKLVWRGIKVEIRLIGPYDFRQSLTLSQAFTDNTGDNIVVHAAGQKKMAVFQGTCAFSCVTVFRNIHNAVRDQ